jgi:hypothetical protein
LALNERGVLVVRSIVIVGATLMAAVLPSGAARAAIGATGIADARFTAGSGTETWEGRTLRFTFWAFQRGPLPPVGYVALRGVAQPPLYTGGDDVVAGPVRCFSVAGTRASLVFTARTTTASYVSVGQPVITYISDVTTPNDASNHDWFGWDTDPPTAEQICNGAAYGAAGAVTQGGVVVRAA